MQRDPQSPHLRHCNELAVRLIVMHKEIVQIAQVARETDSLRDIVVRLQDIGIEVYRQRVARRVWLMREDLVSTGERLPLGAVREASKPTPNAGLIARSWAKHRL